MNAGHAEPVQLPLGLKLDPGATLESFHPGPNAVAVRQLREALPGPAWVYLSGPAGSGKTHLLHAACHAVSAGGGTACLVPLEQSGDWSPEVLQGLHGVDLVCLDGLQAIAGKRDWEVALFNLLNELREAGAGVILAARERPAALSLELPDLRSRLGWGTLLRLQPLDDEDKLAALKLRAKLRGLELPDESAGYLIRRVARDNRSLFRLLDRVDEASLAAQRRLTVPFLREVLTRPDR